MSEHRQPPIFIILNAGSGHLDTTQRQQAIEQVLTAAGRCYHLHLVEQPSQLNRITADAVRQAVAEQGWVVAAGGDGTLNTVAAACLLHRCPFGVLAQGTFNYFSRAQGLSNDLQQACQQLLTARVQPVQVGRVNQQLFLVNASLGLYPQLLEEREAYKSQYGRSRGIAFLAGLRTLLRPHRPLQLDIEYQGQHQQIRASTLLVGNNRLQFEQLGFEEAAALDQGKLAAISLKPARRLEMLGLILRGALGQLGRAERIQSFVFRSLQVQYSGWRARRPIKVAIDGEIRWLQPPLRFEVSPEPLLLLKPDSLNADTPSPEA